MEVCLLGSGGMAPLPERRLTSLLIRQNGRMILVDCGEGTQVGIRMCGWGFKSIDALCLTHYHADHVAGLPGFLLTLGNSGRTEPFTIFGPPPLKHVINALTVIAPELPFEIMLTELSSETRSQYNLGEFLISVLPVEHRIPCSAYCFEIQRSGKFDTVKAITERIPKEYWNHLQKGNTIVCEGREITPEMVLGPLRKGLKVTYCTDARPSDALIEFARDSDLLILEGMYGEDELLSKATERMHMVFSEAATIAAKSESKELWLTHFSPSLRSPEDHLKEAAKIFPKTVIGLDLMTKQLHFA
jgi:ribonuclease Z